MNVIRGKIALLAGLLVCAMVPVGCIPIPLGGSVKGTTPGSSATSKSAPAPTGPVKVGTSLGAGTWKVTVTKVTTSSNGPGGAKPASGKTFLFVETEFKNVQLAETLVVNPKDASLTDFMGTKYPTVGKKIPGYNSWGMRRIGAGLGGSTVFVYQINRRTSGYMFTYSPAGSGKHVKLKWTVR